MSAPTDVPTLEFPADRVFQWAQITTQLAQVLALRREELDRRAWSDAEHAAREHDMAELRAVIDPSARPMPPEMAERWKLERPRVPVGQGATVVTDVALVDGKWGVRAEARHGDRVITEAWVVCKDEETAHALADEIAARGQVSGVDKLRDHADLAAEAASTRHPRRVEEVDLRAAEDRVRAAWPTEAADAAVGCDAWRTLAQRITTLERLGVDVHVELGAMDLGLITSARKPSAFATWQLDRQTGSVAKPDGRRATTRGSASAASSRGAGDAAGEDEVVVVDSPSSGGDRSSRPSPAGRAEEDGPGPLVEEERRAFVVPPPTHTGTEEWVEQLDPSSAVDRVAAEAAVGQFGPAVDARLLRRFPDLLGEEPGPTGPSWLRTTAGDRERDAAAHRAETDDPRTTGREDLHGSDLAASDHQAAVSAHAAAAAEEGPAPLARAAVTTSGPTPTVAAAGSTPPPRPTAAPRAPHRGR